MRYETLSKDYETAKDNLFLRNEELRNKLRDTENILANTKDDYTTYRLNTENVILRNEQSITISNSE